MTFSQVCGSGKPQVSGRIFWRYHHHMGIPRFPAVFLRPTPPISAMAGGVMISGGHMRGYKDDEMEARWAQFGVFSPIMRLHSSCSEFNGKNRGAFKKESEAVMGEFLRLRHRLMPYLYTMNYRASESAEPMIMPMYYKHPKRRRPTRRPTSIISEAR